MLALLILWPWCLILIAASAYAGRPCWPALLALLVCTYAIARRWAAECDRQDREDGIDD